MGSGASTSISPPLTGAPVNNSGTNLPLPFPKDGVKLSFANDFLSLCGGRDKLQGLTTTDVCEKFVKPLTANTQSSYCEILKSQKHPAVGVATIFISHAWKYLFLDVLDSLQHYFKDKSTDIIIWFDLFSNNQHKAVDLSFDWWCNTFKSAIQQFGHTVVVLSPWSDPIPLTRAWCLFEIYCTLDSKSIFDIAMTEKESEMFLKDMQDHGIEAVNKMLSVVDVQRSECFKPDDKTRIFDVVKKTVGFATINSLIFSQLRSWFLTAATDALSKEKDEKKQLPYNSILGRLFTVEGKYDKAEPLLKACVDKAKVLFGPESPESLDAMTNLAILYDEQDKFDLAEPLYVFCFETKKKQFGDDHPDVLLSMNNLAALYNDKSLYDKSEPLFTSCLDKRKKVMGEKHIDTITTMTNLASLYINQNLFTKAEPLLLSCLDIYKEILGNDHPDTLVAMSNLAVMYDQQSNFTKSENLHLTVYGTRKELFGLEDAKTLDSLNNLGVHYHDAGKYADGKPLLQTCVDYRKVILGANHPDTLKSIENLKNIDNKLFKASEKTENIEEDKV